MLITESKIRKIIKNVLLEGNFEAPFAGKLAYFLTHLMLVLSMKIDLYNKNTATRQIFNTQNLPLKGRLTIDFLRTRQNQTDSNVREILGPIQSISFFQGMSGVNIPLIRERLTALRESLQEIESLISAGHATQKSLGSPGKRRESMLRSFSGELRLDYQIIASTTDPVGGASYETSVLSDKGPINVRVFIPTNLGTASNVNGALYNNIFKGLKFALSHELVHSSQFETSLQQTSQRASVGTQMQMQRGVHPIVHLVTTNLSFSPIGMGTQNPSNAGLGYFSELRDAADILQGLIANHFISKGRINPFDQTQINSAIADYQSIQSGNYAVPLIQTYYNMYRRLHDHFSPQEVTAYTRHMRNEALASLSPNSSGPGKQISARRRFENIITNYFQGVFFGPVNDSPLSDLERELKLGPKQQDYKDEAIQDYLKIYDIMYQPPSSDPLITYIGNNQMIQNQQGMEDFLLDTLAGKTPGITDPRTYVIDMLTNMGLTDVPN